MPVLREPSPDDAANGAGTQDNKSHRRSHPSMSHRRDATAQGLRKGFASLRRCGWTSYFRRVYALALRFALLDDLQICLRGGLLVGAHRVEALLERLHQVHDLRGHLHSRRDEFFACDLRVDDVLKALTVFVAVLVQIELLLECRDDLLGQLHFLGLHFGRDRGELFDAFGAANLSGVMKRVHHEASVVRFYRDEVFAPVKRELADADLAFHSLAEDGECVGCHLPIRRKVVRPIHVHRVEGAGVVELDEVDDAGGRWTHLLDVVLRHDDVPPLFELVALHELGVGDLLITGRAPSLLLDTGLALAVELVERERAA